MNINVVNKKPAGFTLTELMIVVAIIGLLASIAITNFRRARETSVQTLCINNLNHIYKAKQTWALENRKSSFDTPAEADLFGPGMFMTRKPECGGSGNYLINPVGEFPTCDRPGHVMP